MKLRSFFRMIMLAAVMLVVCVCASAEDWVNPAYEYYYQQLTPNQQAMYRVILEAPSKTAEYTVVLPDLCMSEEEAIRALNTTVATIVMDHPETMAWFSWVKNISFDENSNAVTFELICWDCYNPEDQALSERLIDTIVDAADPSWDLYHKAVFVSNAVRDALDYDWKCDFLSSEGRAYYYNNNVLCVNNGYAVCGGFSKLYKAIADRIGLPCVEVGSVGHAWVHVLMEDGNWYGVEPQNPLYLQGTSTMLGWSYLDPDHDMYELYDGFFDEDGSIRQPERTVEDYEYVGTVTELDRVDLTKTRLDNAATETTFLYQINEDGKSCTITGFTGKESGDLVIPDSMDGYPVTAIGNSAFVYANFDGTLTLPDTIESIDVQAFAGCDRLNGQLILPANLKKIENAAFIGCSGFTGEIVFNDKLEKIGRAAIAGCIGLSGSLMLPDSVVEMEHSAIYNCQGLDGVLHIPKGITSWSAVYVMQCDNLTGFEVSSDHPDYATVDGILYSCDMTRLLQCSSKYTGAVVIPEGVTTIGEQAFYRCNQITSISFPSTLKRIEAWACAATEGITEPIVLPDGLEYLGDYAFQLCSGIRGTLVVPAGVKLAAGVFSTCQQINTVIIEEGVRELPEDTFYFCTEISRIFFPTTIENIGHNCFWCVTQVKIFGALGSFAEDYANSEEGQEMQAEFYPLTKGYNFATNEIFLSLLEAENSRTFQLIIEPQQPFEAVIWRSSDESVATVDNGLVTGISVGQATITATFGDITLQCTVVVHDGVRISGDGKTLVKVSTFFEGQLIIPEGVENIDEYAINTVDHLSGITFPGTLKSLGTWSLYGVGYLHDLRLILPESVTRVDANAFVNNRFDYVRYPVGTDVGQAAYLMNTINVLELPEGVTDLPKEVFANSLIEKCYLPVSLTSAPLNAFDNTQVGAFYIYSGTYAEEYVKKLIITYPDMGCDVVLLDQIEPGGDANEDGIIDVYDALLILQYNAGWDVPICIENADANGDGIVGIDDALQILKSCLGDLSRAARALQIMLKNMDITALAIVTQPADQYAAEGHQAEFAVSAVGDGVAYQWYINRNDGAGWKLIPGATSSAYTMENVSIADDGYRYYCAVTSDGGMQAISNEAALHVTPAVELPMTGDAADPLLWFSLMAASLAGMLLLTVYSRKRPTLNTK